MAIPTDALISARAWSIESLCFYNTEVVFLLTFAIFLFSASEVSFGGAIFAVLRPPVPLDFAFDGDKGLLVAAPAAKLLSSALVAFRICADSGGICLLETYFSKL